MHGLVIFCISITALIKLVTCQMSVPQSWRYYRNLRESEAESVQVRKEYLESKEEDIMRLKADMARLTEAFRSLEEKYDSLKSEISQINSIQRDQPPRSTLKVQCRSEFTWWHEAVGKSLEFLDNFDVHCRHGEFLRQWRMTWGEMSGKKAIRYVCCKYGHDPD